MHARALVLAQKLQNETVPALRLLPEGAVAGLRHSHKLAMGDMRREHPHQGWRTQEVSFADEYEDWDSYGLQPCERHREPWLLPWSLGPLWTAAVLDLKPAARALGVGAPVRGSEFT